MTLFKEVYFSNSEDEISEITAILESKSIHFSINEKDKEDANGKENYSYSISVEENKVSEVLELIKPLTEENLPSQKNKKVNNNSKPASSKQNHSRQAFTYIVTAAITIAMIGSINLGNKIYSKYQSKKRVAVLYNEKKSSMQKEMSPEKNDKTNELLKKTKFTIEEYSEYRKLTGETHGINVFASAEEIALPKDLQVHGLRNMCYDDEFQQNDEAEIITETNISYENGICKVKISQEDYVKYNPFKVTASIPGKMYEEDCYDSDEDNCSEYGTVHSFSLKHHDYTKDLAPYSVRLVSKETNTCIIERLVELIPDESISIFEENADTSNPFKSGWRSIEFGKKYKIYFPKFNSNSELVNETVYDSLVFSKRVYVNGGGYICNVPFAIFKTKKSFEKMNLIEFSMSETMEFHLDLYSSSNNAVDYSTWDNNFESKCPYDKVNSKKIDIPPGTIWTVNSTDGLNVRSRPYGKRIAGIVNKTKLLQSEPISLAYEDIIDDVYGFWIPVEINDNELIGKVEDLNYTDYVLSDYPKITGWVFTGYCTEEKK